MLDNGAICYQEIFIPNTIDATGSKLISGHVAGKPRSTQANKFIRHFSSKRKRYVRGSLLLANLVLFAGVAFLVSTAKSEPVKPLQSSPGLLNSSQDDVAGPLDELSSADIAVNVARITGLPEANSVKNKADTINAGLAVASADEKVVAKPQIVSEGLKSKKDIIKYKTVKGDTIKSIAKKFGVKPDTIRNSNNLTGDTVAVGVEIMISPVDGIVYQVSSGDSPESIASKFRVDKTQLVAINDAELTNKFKVGDYIIVPDGLPPVQETSYHAPSASGGSSYSFGLTPIYRANAYDYGWCTWHAANRRYEIGRPIPSNLGNAVSWLSAARAAGLPTGTEPRDGAVLSQLNIGGLGHVAFVEKVNSDGSFLVSDMNYPIWGKVTYRTVPASDKGNYRFIY